MILQKNLSAYLHDAKLAEQSMALLDKYLALYWNQSDLIASNLPLFLQVNSQMELSLLNLQSLQKVHSTSLQSKSAKDAMSLTLIMARSWEQFKQKEHSASIEQCLADEEKLRAFNQMEGEGKCKNAVYNGLLASKWLNSITNLLTTSESDASTEDFISHTQVEVNFDTSAVADAKERFGSKTSISLLDYIKTLLK